MKAQILQLFNLATISYTEQLIMYIMNIHETYNFEKFILIDVLFYAKWSYFLFLCDLEAVNLHRT